MTSRSTWLYWVPYSLRTDSLTSTTTIYFWLQTFSFRTGTYIYFFLKQVPFRDVITTMRTITTKTDSVLSEMVLCLGSVVFFTSEEQRVLKNVINLKKGRNSDRHGLDPQFTIRSRSLVWGSSPLLSCTGLPLLSHFTFVVQTGQTLLGSTTRLGSVVRQKYVVERIIITFVLPPTITRSYTFRMKRYLFFTLF